jgi:hypothetical protein
MMIVFIESGYFRSNIRKKRKRRIFDCIRMRKIKSEMSFNNETV